MDILTNPTFLDRTNLVWEWLLDWDATDTWGSNNWTATNVTWVASERGYTSEVWDFNGSSSYVSLWNNIFTSAELSDFTISYWMKLDTISWDRSFDFEARILNQINADWTLEFRIFDGSTYDTISTSAWEISTWEWYHIVNTRNSTQSELFINNVSKWTFASAWPVELDAVSREWRIWSYFSWWNWFDWKIWLFKIYDVALSQTEREDLYQEWLRRFWPTNLLFNNTDFSKYSLANLQDGKVLEISKPIVSTTYYNQIWDWNDFTWTSITDTAVWLNNEMSFNGTTSKLVWAWYTAGQEANTYWITKNFSYSFVVNLDNVSWSKWWINIWVRNVWWTSWCGFLSYFVNDTLSTFIFDTTITRTIYTTWSIFTAWEKKRLTVVREDTDLRIFLNGVLVASTNTIPNINLEWTVPTGREAYDAFWLFKSEWWESSFFAWDFYDIKLRNRALSNSEVYQDHYSNFITN